jgi:hypothetical protein
VRAEPESKKRQREKEGKGGKEAQWGKLSLLLSDQNQVLIVFCTIDDGDDGGANNKCVVGSRVVGCSFGARACGGLQQHGEQKENETITTVGL